jgi:formamidopyrimidine-DNA glycosylase
LFEIGYNDFIQSVSNRGKRFVGEEDMLEYPEANVLAFQLNHSLTGKMVQYTAANSSPHKFTFYSGDPADYPNRLNGHSIGSAAAYGGWVELTLGEVSLAFNDGVNLRYHAALPDAPKKHQLLLTFSDGSALSTCVAMYGGIACYPSGTYDNPYYLTARQKPAPLSEAFDWAYFNQLLQPETLKLSLKAFLATEQRIPGLGNGVLQDILYNAGLHPRKKVDSLEPAQLQALYKAIKNTLSAMLSGGGRDLEKDLFGAPGAYRTVVSKNTAGQPCLRCGQTIQKEAYLGGSIYFCPGCQMV